MGQDGVNWMRPNFMAHNYHNDSTVIIYNRQHVKLAKRNYVLHLRNGSFVLIFKLTHG